MKNIILENSFVISCNDTKLNKMKEKFDEYQLPFPEVFKSLGSCEESHYALLEYIKYKKLPYCTIFEDDAWPYDKTIQELQKLNDILEKHLDEIAIVGLGSTKLRRGNRYIRQHTYTINIYDNVFYHNTHTVPNANAIFLNCAEIDNRIQSILRKPISIFQYDKKLCNYADRYQQCDFQRLCLYVTKPLFWHCDVIKKLYICNTMN